VRRLLHEPLLHFLILGALLFGLYSGVHRGAAGAAGEIVVTRGQLQSLQAQFERTRQRPPTAEERQDLIDTWVREEIFYREGVAMGLDRDDPVVRRRVAQKLEFIADASAPPTPAELQDWLDSHADRYRIEPRYTLTQVYLDVARHGDKLDADVANLRRSLDRGRAVDGDSTLLPPTLERATASELTRAFGRAFADAVASLPLGSWQGPVRSTFGVHLVRVSAVQPARAATLDEARAAVERDFAQERAAHLDAERYRKLRARYVVRIDATPVP